MGVGTVRAGEERERLESLPNVGVGPLRFGMSSAEVADALQVSGPQERAGGPYRREDFADGGWCFTTRANWRAWRWMRSPVLQVYLAGFAPAGRDPEQAHQYLLGYAAEHGNCLLYTPDDLRPDLGLILRAQQIADVHLSRPLFVIEEWLDSEYYRERLPLERHPGHAWMGGAFVAREPLPGCAGTLPAPCSTRQIKCSVTSATSQPAVGHRTLRRHPATVVIAAINEWL